MNPLIAQSVMDAHDGKCAICGTTKPAGKGWAMDHDHATLKVRGVLCSLCKVGLGAFGDDPQRLLDAPLYLYRSQYALV